MIEAGKFAVARKIYDTLGGQMLDHMCGPYEYVGSDLGLTFKMPNSIFNLDIRYVEIMADGENHYACKFFAHLSVVPTVYNNKVLTKDLMGVFETATNLKLTYFPRS